MCMLDFQTDAIRLDEEEKKWRCCPYHTDPRRIRRRGQRKRIATGCASAAAPLCGSAEHGKRALVTPCDRFLLDVSCRMRRPTGAD